MSYDLGPFQNLVGISFPGFCAPGNLHPYFMQSGEPFMLRKDGENYPSGYNIVRTPGSSYQKLQKPGTSCAYARFDLSVFIPKSAEWPDCGFGATSGGGFRKSYFPKDPTDSSPVACTTYNGPGVCVNITGFSTYWRLRFVFKWDCACPSQPGDPFQGCGDPATDPPIG